MSQLDAPFTEEDAVKMTVVWATLKGYPPWPAEVMRTSGPRFTVRFFATDNEATLPASALKRYHTKQLKLRAGQGKVANAQLQAQFFEAVKLADVALREVLVETEDWRLEGSAWIGQRVRRFFPGGVISDALVQRWLPAGNTADDAALWHVRHDDGDEEDLEEEELREALVSYREGWKVQVNEPVLRQALARYHNEEHAAADAAARSRGAAPAAPLAPMAAYEHLGYSPKQPPTATAATPAAKASHATATAATTAFQSAMPTAAASASASERRYPDGMDAVHAALVEMRLEGYAAALEAEGWDDLNYLAAVDEKRRREVGISVGMKPGHAMKFSMLLLRAAGHVRATRGNLT